MILKKLKNITVLLSLLALVIFSCKKTQKTDTPGVADPDLNDWHHAISPGKSDNVSTSARTISSKPQILSYISGMAASNTIISGQHCEDGDNIATGYTTWMVGCYNLTGKYPAIAGADYGYKVNNLDTINNNLVRHWNAGGLVALTWHADNPFARGYNSRINPVQAKNKIDLSKLLKSAPSSTAKTNYRNELASVAAALVKLKDAGVTAIWRPFHEMNGDFFWWGINSYNNGTQTNIQAYINLWIDLYNTLTVDYGLTNLIWVYSPIKQFTWSATVTAYFPGSAYVDLVGEDVYGVESGIPDYTSLQTLGKPIVLGECGPESANYGQYDEVKMVNNSKGKACYFLQWHSWPGAAVAIIDNLNAAAMMQSTTVISRDELP